MVDRQNLIKQYGDRAEMFIVNALGVQGYNERTHSGLCPFHNEKTPSFKYDTKTHKFKCFGCGESVDIVSYYIEHENISFIEATKRICDEIGIPSGIEDNTQQKRIDNKTYKRPSVNYKPLTEAMIKFCEERMITDNTLKQWRVAASTEYFPKTKENKGCTKGCYVFPCYDEYNDLVNCSFRSRDKDFVQVTDAKSILWGMWQCDYSETLVITEGQFDAMSIWQAGHKNVVSIPAGANNYNYIENCHSFLSKFDDIIFWIDNDEPGKNAGRIFQSRFPKARILHHSECKDANEVLMKLGPNEVMNFINQKPPLPKGIKKIADAAYDVNEPLDNDRVELGFKDFDQHVDDWRMSQLSLIFGRDGEGKTTFISQVVAHQLHRRMKTFLYSAELGEQTVQDWLYKQLIGDKSICYEKKQGKYKPYYSIKSPVIKAIRAYTDDVLYIVDESDDEIISNNDVLFEHMRVLASKHGVKLFILDNLQAILTSKFNDINRDQSFFMERCRQFAKRHKVHVIVVAHPHKTEELEVDEKTVTGNLKKDSVSGSKDITNKAHNVLSVERDFEAKFFDMILTNLKDKHEGMRKGFKYHFHRNTLRYYNDSVSVNVQKDFSVYLPQNVAVNDGKELHQQYLDARGEK